MAMLSTPSIRQSKRRRLVFTVLVLRREGQEKYLAHTIDLTDCSARVGGLTVMLEPGETVEIKRKAQKAKFQVIWMGAPGSAMEGQAGFHGLEPNRSIWDVDLSQEHLDDESTEPETGPEQRQPNPPTLRIPTPVVTVAPGAVPPERRLHPRFACEGAATVRALTGDLVAHGPVKDISAGGIYIETLIPFPVNTAVNVKLAICDVWVDVHGEVRASHASIGMGIAFQGLTSEVKAKLDHILQTLKGPEPQQRPQVPTSVGISAPEMASACRRIADHFEEWKRNCSEAEFREVRKAMEQLQQKFIPLAPDVDPHGFHRGAEGS
jgi:hypothetical protein